MLYLGKAGKKVESGDKSKAAFEILADVISFAGGLSTCTAGHYRSLHSADMDAPMNLQGYDLRKCCEPSSNPT